MQPVTKFPFIRARHTFADAYVCLAFFIFCPQFVVYLQKPFLEVISIPYLFDFVHERHPRGHFTLDSIQFWHRNECSMTFYDAHFLILSTRHILEDISRFTLSHFVNDTLARGHFTLHSIPFCHRNASSMTFHA